MLSTCTTKDIQNIIFRVATFSLSNIPDWSTHCFICDLNKSQSDFLDAKWSFTLIATVYGICQLRESREREKENYSIQICKLLSFHYLIVLFDSEIFK